MHDELTNLLPPERERAISRDYALRVCVVSAAIVTVLTLAAAALLIPIYILLSGSENAKKIHLANIESTFSSAEEVALSSRLSALSSNVAALTAMSNSPSASAIIRAVLAVAHPGITLYSFSYTPLIANNFGTLTVSGSSATRDALRGYQLALQEERFARSATLPVSAYAKDNDIDFTITITLSP